MAKLRGDAQHVKNRCQGSSIAHLNVVGGECLCCSGWGPEIIARWVLFDCQLCSVVAAFPSKAYRLFSTDAFSSLELRRRQLQTALVEGGFAFQVVPGLLEPAEFRWELQLPV